MGKAIIEATGMQIVLLIVAYLISAFINHRAVKKQDQGDSSAAAGYSWTRFKRAVIAAMIGLAGVMTLDLFSQGQPVWPALGLIAVIVGELAPFWKTAARQNTGLASYFGGILYLNPVLVLICAGLALEIGLVGKDSVLAMLLFTSLAPVLIWYARMNPVFLWAAIAAGLLIVWGLKAELWNRIRSK